MPPLNKGGRQYYPHFYLTTFFGRQPSKIRGLQLAGPPPFAIATNLIEFLLVAAMPLHWLSFDWSPQLLKAASLLPGRSQRRLA